MDQQKKITVILGASPNPARYSYLAVNRLLKHGHSVLPIGIRDGEVSGIRIVRGTPAVSDADTITLYLNAERQKEYYDYIISLKPRRIIFNPGTENPELQKIADENGIEWIEACTLVMLSTNTF
jgi:predicted CoA-binding protein